jgi:hypothetical protein
VDKQSGFGLFLTGTLVELPVWDVFLYSFHSLGILCFPYNINLVPKLTHEIILETFTSHKSFVFLFFHFNRDAFLTPFFWAIK